MEQVKLNLPIQTTCVNRVGKRTKKCEVCTKDYDITHHPNNLDCNNHEYMIIHLFTVK